MTAWVPLVVTLLPKLSNGTSDEAENFKDSGVWARADPAVLVLRPNPRSRFSPTWARADPWLKRARRFGRRVKLHSMSVLRGARASRARLPGPEPTEVIPDAESSGSFRRHGRDLACHARAPSTLEAGKSAALAR